MIAYSVQTYFTSLPYKSIKIRVKNLAHIYSALGLALVWTLPEHFEKKPEFYPLEIVELEKAQKAFLKQQKKNYASSVKKCQSIIKEMEKKYDIPQNLLYSIACVESRSRPWTVWVKGKGYYFKNQEQAKNFILEHHEKGNTQMFIGCMQICLRTHGPQFDSIEAVLDPHQNIKYAAKLLKRLYHQYGSWEDAVMYYNASSNMEAYRDKVLDIWKGEEADL